jgi:hypothetical protein
MQNKYSPGLAMGLELVTLQWIIYLHLMLPLQTAFSTWDATTAQTHQLST